jgi:serine/threonine protein kinase
VSAPQQPYGPLEIRGFTFERVLGSGGFADVFVYGQHMPKRRVAVKIMRAVVAAKTARAQFESEANLMAQLSNHPSIVTIHFAAVAENGRPFLVMEYCSGPNLADRVRQRPLAVPEMLQVTIRLCGAVETAHREGILHRDIKPANVLTTDYGWPALTDFGISVIAGEATIGDGGMSIPWAPPEAIGAAGTLDVRSDIYSLGATAYTLLVGHSPFDKSTGTADIHGLMQRIHTDPVPPIGRSDVPYELEHLLALAMSKDPDDRPQSASEFARGLQRIEQEMNLPVTHMDVRGGLLHEVEGVDEFTDIGEKTRLRSNRDDDADPAVVIDPDVDESTRLNARTVQRRAQGARPDDSEVVSDDDQADIDEKTRVAQRREVDDKTRVVRRDEIDDKTRVARRGDPDDKAHPRVEEPAEPDEGTKARPRARGVAVQTTAADLPRRAERVAYIPGKDPEGVNQRYGVRTASTSAPIIRRAPTAPPTTMRAQAPVDVVASADRRLRAKNKRRTMLIAVIVGGMIVLIAVAVFVVITVLAAG